MYIFFALALLAVACGSETPKPVSKDGGLKLPDEEGNTCNPLCPNDNGINKSGYWCDTSQKPGVCIPRCEKNEDCPPDEQKPNGDVIDNYCDAKHDPKICAQFLISGGN